MCFQSYTFFASVDQDIYCRYLLYGSRYLLRGGGWGIKVKFTKKGATLLGHCFLIGTVLTQFFTKMINLRG